MLIDVIESKIKKSIFSNKAVIQHVAETIYNNPEISFKEYKSVQLLTDLLRNNGFQVKKGEVGLDTSFRAELKGKKDGPTIALVAEYDALPNLGHACGHHLIAAGVVGVALSMASIWPEIKGNLVVLGTPAEEGGGGKVLMLERGLWEGIDMVLSYHPSGATVVAPDTKASFIVEISLESIGQVELSLFDSYQEVIKLLDSFELNIQSNIIKGAVSSKPFPANVIAVLKMSAMKETILEDALSCLKDKFNELNRSPAINATINKVIPYYKLKSDPKMVAIFRKRLTSMGFKESQNYVKIGASDLGTISKTIPCLCPLLPLVEPNLDFHTTEFAMSAHPAKTENKLLQIVELLSLTLIDLIIEN